MQNGKKDELTHQQRSIKSIKQTHKKNLGIKLGKLRQVES